MRSHPQITVVFDNPTWSRARLVCRGDVAEETSGDILAL